MNYAKHKGNTSVYDDVDINALMILVWNQELEQHQKLYTTMQNENHQDEDDCQSYFPNALPLVHDTTPSAQHD